MAKRKEVLPDIPKELPFHPTIRPPIASLIVCDDGTEKGESIRIRSEKFVIGRTEGDLQLPHDEMVSSRHVAIIRQATGGNPQIAVTDLASRNGLFVRVSKAPLLDNAEVLIGSGLFRMEIAPGNSSSDSGALDSSDEKPFVTRAMEGQHSEGTAVLCEVVASGAASRFRLEDKRYLIGRDEECDICQKEDEFLAAKHALLTRSGRGTWVIENQKTLNGIWLRMPKVVVSAGKSCEFRIGEQRFRLKLGSRQ